MSGQDVEPPNPDPANLQWNVWFLTLDPHRLIYGTIILMTAFAIYDEGSAPLQRGPLFELLGVALAPLFALAMAHAFSDALDLQIRNGRRLSGADRRHVAAINLQYLYVALPPALLISILTIAQWDANKIVAIVEILGVLSLAAWGSLAAQTAGLGRWRQATFAVNYALMGLLVIGVELAITH